MICTIDFRRLLLIVLILFLSGCSGSQPPVDDAPMPAPTFTPTPDLAPDLATASTPDAVFNLAASIDKFGRDIAERRVIDVYEKVAPSVVNITTRAYRRGFFFEPTPQEGAGSGFVLDTEGHILTNYHVVQGAERVEVNFDDGVVREARIMGVDQRNDVALLQVDVPAELLHPVEFGASTNLQVGQRAIAIGNPFGQFSRTLTTGVISSLDRQLESPDGRTITGIIQTDAAINKGNSGGPLLDSQGKVIGITTAIFSPTGASAGIGFAVPVDTLSRLLPDLLTLGRYRHPWLGVRYAYTLTPGLVDALDLPEERGLLLVQFLENSPLARAGVLAAQQELVIGNQIIYTGGDILIAIDGQEITGMESLQTLLENEYQVGDRVTVKLRRGREVIEVVVELVEER